MSTAPRPTQCRPRSPTTRLRTSRRGLVQLASLVVVAAAARRLSIRLRLQELCLRRRSERRPWSGRRHLSAYFAPDPERATAELCDLFNEIQNEADPSFD